MLLCAALLLKTKSLSLNNQHKAAKGNILKSFSQNNHHSKSCNWSATITDY